MKNLGELGFSKYCITKDGRVYSLRSERFLSIQDRGYQMINLTSDTGEQIYVYVHRLVAFAYCDGYEEGLHVNHIDGNKCNNYYTNLEWVTRSQNMVHARRNGLIKSSPSINEETAHRICRMLEQGGQPIDVSRAIGVTIDSVKDILRKRSFQYISCEYDFSKVKRKCRLSEDKVLKICELLMLGYSCKEVSKLVDTLYNNVVRIRAKETFQHLTSQYDFPR